jgi:hypothetical protein
MTSRVIVSDFEAKLALNGVCGRYKLKFPETRLFSERLGTLINTAAVPISQIGLNKCVGLIAQIVESGTA